MGGSKALENAFDIILAVEKNLEGAIVECGVAEEVSAMMAMTSKFILTF